MFKINRLMQKKLLFAICVVVSFLALCLAFGSEGDISIPIKFRNANVKDFHSSFFDGHAYNWSMDVSIENKTFQLSFDSEKNRKPTIVETNASSNVTPQNNVLTASELSEVIHIVNNWLNENEQRYDHKCMYGIHYYNFPVGYEHSAIKIAEKAINDSVPCLQFSTLQKKVSCLEAADNALGMYGAMTVVNEVGDVLYEIVFVA